MKKIILILTLLGMPLLHADAIISLFLRPYPLGPSMTVDDAERRIQRPDKTAYDRLRALAATNIQAGIFASYAGNLEVSDMYGQVNFIRLHEKPEIDVLITPAYNVVPVRMIANTLHHWEVLDASKTELYHIKRQQDPATRLYFWHTQKRTLPEDNIIGKNALLIFTKPPYLFVPTGITLTDESPHLVLPAIYVKRGVMKITNALSMLSLRQFFGPVDSAYQKEEKRYSHQPKPR